MIIKEKAGAEIEEIIGGNEDIDCSIDLVDQNKLFQLLSRGLYKRPIEAVCREIASNCFDSHIEAEVEKPVTIIFDEDENGKFIVFKDEGVGLSPERFDAVYKKYLKSTKGNTNNQIGMFGLGSKTPFSVTNIYYIITVFEGIKYTYQGTMTNLPKYNLFLEEETNEHNGTEIKIYFTEESTDSKFNDALKSQLIYFDEIIYKYKYYFYSDDKIDNNYNIIESNTFKYNTILHAQYDVLHLILGKVVYPIDWRIITPKMKERLPNIELPIKLGVGVKFDIGELMITPSREEIVYDEATIDLIIDKIESCLSEIKDIYNKTNVYDNFIDWISATKVFKSKLKKAYYHSSMNDPIGNIFLVDGDKIDITDIKYLLPKPIFKPLEKYNLQVDLHISDFLSNYNQMYSYPRFTKNINNLIYSLEHKHKLVYSKDNNLEGKLKNTYLNEYRVVKLKPLLNIDKKEIMKKWFPTNTNVTLGKPFLYKEIKDIIIKHVFETYNIIDYDNLELPEEWVKNYYDSKKTGSAKVKISGEMSYRDLIGDYQKDAKIDSICSKNELLIYSFLDSDKEKVELIRKLLYSLNKSNNKSNNKYTLWRIAKTNEKYLLKLRNQEIVTLNKKTGKWQKRIITKNIFEINEFMDNYNTITARYFTYLFLTNSKLWFWMENNKNELNYVCPSLYTKIDNLNKFVIKGSKEFRYANIPEEMSKEILLSAIKNNMLYFPIYSIYKELENYFEDIEDIVINLTDANTIIKLLKKYNKKLNWQHYSEISEQKIKNMESWKAQLQPFKLINVPLLPDNGDKINQIEVSWL
tara:strand:- start:9324 stop:11741 length:2418 start_codon:yes stop_codon:yes gene_type:complete